MYALNRKSTQVSCNALQLLFLSVLTAGGLSNFSSATANDSDPPATDTGLAPNLAEPHKQLIPTIKIAKAIGWKDDIKPTVANGFSIEMFADNLDHPRWLYVLPNGDVLVAETNAPPRKDDGKGFRGWFMKKFKAKGGAGTASADRITLLRDADRDGIAEQRFEFASHLHSPLGMALVGQDFYVANTDSIMKFHYSPNQTSLDGNGELIASLPAGTINHHWTKNLIASRDGRFLYATVGSNSNVAENGMDNELQRACILKIELTTRAVTVFASGLRNPNGLAWHPSTGELWTAVNERDEIGDMIVPDYITSVRENGFYGWPYSYFGTHVDHRIAPQNSDRVAQAIPPDFAVGAHTASLGLAFYSDNSTVRVFPEHYWQGAFIGQHGSWNRSDFAGYKVVFVPFDSNGRPIGPVEDFVTGFLNDDNEALGRPVGVVIDKSGALLVADDVGNRIWRVVPISTKQ
jgi:glucose/arabinose dehydrogenase